MNHGAILNGNAGTTAGDNPRGSDRSTRTVRVIHAASCASRQTFSSDLTKIIIRHVARRGAEKKESACECARSCVSVREVHKATMGYR